MIELLKAYSAPEKIGLVLLAAVAAHLLVRLVRFASIKFTSAGSASRQTIRKIRTLASLTASALIFVLYAAVIGYAFFQFNISLTSYLAGVSIIGIAVAFGLQGLVQDVVTGLTIIFYDLFDVGDMVEVGGQLGVVREIGIRFTVLENALGSEVFLQNRSIANVIAYKRAYIRCNVDVTLSRDESLRNRQEVLVRELTDALVEQFPRIHRAPPEIVGRQTTSSGRTYVRIKFRIWPGRGGPIETAFLKEILTSCKEMDPAYADWMITVNYEVEQEIMSKGS